jgi:hypothetical protein
LRITHTWEEDIVSNASQRNDKGSASSGHGAHGMGGQPNDNPRDLGGKNEGLTDDDRRRAVGVSVRTFRVPCVAAKP